MWQGPLRDILLVSPNIKMATTVIITIDVILHDKDIEEIKQISAI